MTFQELLREQGVSDEQIGNIEGGMRENRMYLSSEENIDLRYTKLRNKHEEAEKLIESLKKDAETSAETSRKVTEYEGRINELTAQIERDRLDSAVREALLASDATDVDYLMYKLRNGDAELRLGADGKVEGLQGRIESLRASYPNQFRQTGKDGRRTIPNRLEKPDPDNGAEPMTRSKLDRMRYNERLRFRNEHPDEYRRLMGRGEAK